MWSQVRERVRRDVRGSPTESERPNGQTPQVDNRNRKLNGVTERQQIGSDIMTEKTRKNHENRENGRQSDRSGRQVEGMRIESKKNRDRQHRERGDSDERSRSTSSNTQLDPNSTEHHVGFRRESYSCLNVPPRRKLMIGARSISLNLDNSYDGSAAVLEVSKDINRHSGDILKQTNRMSIENGDRSRTIQRTEDMTRQNGGMTNRTRGMTNPIYGMINETVDMTNKTLDMTSQTGGDRSRHRSEAEEIHDGTRKQNGDVARCNGDVLYSKTRHNCDQVLRINEIKLQVSPNQDLNKNRLSPSNMSENISRKSSGCSYMEQGGNEERFASNTDNHLSKLSPFRDINTNKLSPSRSCYSSSRRTSTGTNFEESSFEDRNGVTRIPDYENVDMNTKLSPYRHVNQNKLSPSRSVSSRNSSPGVNEDMLIKKILPIAELDEQLSFRDNCGYESLKTNTMDTDRMNDSWMCDTDSLRNSTSILQVRVWFQIVFFFLYHRVIVKIFFRQTCLPFVLPLEESI